tara:strand:- start:75 stop:1013 length:939 start_codon:yes stop_codon:yes gene_type:complete
MLILFSSIAFTTVLIFLIYPFLKRYFLDYPVPRSSHSIPTPKGGGIVFALIGIISSLFFKNNLIIICLPLAIIGLFDDKYNLQRRIRFLAQFIISILILKESSLFLVVVNLFNGSNLLIILFAIIAILGIIAFINFTNFLDGLDGLLCGCMIIAFSVQSYFISPSLLPLIGALIAFLPWNWSPAKLFMGDSGSLFLGATFIAYALNAYTLEHFFGLILIVTPLWSDAFFCVIRRFINKQNIFTPHKLHLFQRLNQSGLSHTKVSSIYIFATVFISVVLVSLNTFYALVASLLVIGIGIYLDKFVAVKFSKSF